MIEEMILTAEEQILLSSLDGRTKADCMEEIEELLAITPIDDDSYEVVNGLYEKLKTEKFDIQSEMIDIDEEVPKM